MKMKIFVDEREIPRSLWSGTFPEIPTLREYIGFVPLGLKGFLERIAFEASFSNHLIRKRGISLRLSSKI